LAEEHIYKIAASGSIPSFRISGSVRFDPDEVATRKAQRLPGQQLRDNDGACCTGGLGVSVVPSALAWSSPHSEQLHTLLIRMQDQELPKWRIGIATRTERHTALGKTTVDLILDTLATSRTT